MKLSIESLSEVGAFTGAPVEREVTWKQDGKEITATVYVRRLSYHTAVSDLKATRDKKDMAAARIASCICDENGDQLFTAEDVTGDADPDRGPFNGNLTLALLAVIGEVNSVGKMES